MIQGGQTQADAVVNVNGGQQGKNSTGMELPRAKKTGQERVQRAREEQEKARRTEEEEEKMENGILVAYLSFYVYLTVHMYLYWLVVIFPPRPVSHLQMILQKN